MPGRVANIKRPYKTVVIEEATGLFTLSGRVPFECINHKWNAPKYYWSKAEAIEAVNKYRGDETHDRAFIFFPDKRLEDRGAYTYI